MRDVSDIKTASVSVLGTVELDLERVEMDPIWETVARSFDLEDPAQKKMALEQYIGRYLAAEVVLANAPFTNGPVAVIGTNVEVKQ